MDMSIPSHRLFGLLCFMSLLSYSITSEGWRNSKADLSPVDPVFEEGATIVLTCNFTKYYNGSQNSSLMAFKHNRTIFGPEYVRLLSPSSAELQLPNATLGHYGTFVCFLLPNETMGLHAMQHVSIARRPIKPVLQDCMVHNWNYLECTWSPSKEVQKNYSQSNVLRSEMFWYLKGNESNVCSSNLTENYFKLVAVEKSYALETSHRSCDFQMGRVYCLQVEVTNTLNKPVTSDTVCHNTSLIVRPNPPKTITHSIGKDNVSVILNWIPPSSNSVLDSELTYDLTYNSEWVRTNVSLKNFSSSTMTLRINPYTSYKVWLRVKPSSSGFWSDQQNYEFQTPPLVPCQQPVLHARGFTILQQSNSNRTVRVFWQPILTQNFCGPGFGYTASLKYVTDWNTVAETNSSTLDVLVLSDDVADIRILAKNNLGVSSAPYKIIRVPPSNGDVSNLSPVYEIIVERDKNEPSFAQIRWSYVSDPANITAVTVFWCSSSSSSTLSSDTAWCKTTIEWKELNKLHQECNLTISSDQMESLWVGVSVDVKGISYGIKWSKSFYDMSEAPAPPENLVAVNPHGGGRGQVYVTWKKPVCQQTSCGHADAFVIKYCLLGDGDLCIGDYKSVTVTSREYAYNLTDLDHSSKYKIWMLSRGRIRDSVDSKAFFIVTRSAWDTPSTIVGITIGATVILIVVLFGLYSTYRFCMKYQKKFTLGVDLVIPKTVSVQKNTRTSSSSDRQMLYQSFPSGYSRQGSDLSTMSRDSGRFSLTQPYKTEAVVLQQMSPLMSKPNGTLMVSTMTPLIGIQEDAATDDVFPEMQGFDGTNYVKTTIIDDPDSSSGYKQIHTIHSYKSKDKPSIYVDNTTPEIQYRMQPDAINHPNDQAGNTSLPNLDLYARPDILLCAVDNPSGSYIHVHPGASATDINLLYLPVDQSSPCPSLSPAPFPLTDINYTTVEMLNPVLSFPVGARHECATTNLGNGYTDLAFLTSSFVGDTCQLDSNCGLPSVDTTGKSNQQGDTGSVPVPNTIKHDQGHGSVDLVNSADSLSSKSMDADCKQTTDSVMDCLNVVMSSDPNYAHIGIGKIDWKPVTAAQVDPLLCAEEIRERDSKDSCISFIPSAAGACDNGYIRHNDIYGATLSM